MGNKKILFFDIDNIRIIETLETEKIDEFAYELSSITFHIEMVSVNSPVGYTIIIYMENRELIVLSCTVIGGIAYGMAAIFLKLKMSKKIDEIFLKYF